MDLFVILCILLLAVMFAAAIVIALEPSERRSRHRHEGFHVSEVHDTRRFSLLLGSRGGSTQGTGGHHRHHAHHSGHHHHGSSGLHHAGGHHFGGGHDAGGMSHGGADASGHGHH
jgi:hypothetical protein